MDPIDTTAIAAELPEIESLIAGLAAKISTAAPLIGKELSDVKGALDLLVATLTAVTHPDPEIVAKVKSDAHRLVTRTWHFLHKTAADVTGDVAEFVKGDEAPSATDKLPAQATSATTAGVSATPAPSTVAATTEQASGAK